MIRINLLPFRAKRQKETIKLEVGIYVLGVILLIAGVLWYNSHLAGKIESLKSEKAKLIEKIAAYNKIVEEVERLKKELSNLQKKLDAIYQLNLNREDAFRLLDTLNAMVIPERMWLMKFNSKSKIQRTRKKVKGKKKKKTMTKTVVEVKIGGTALDSKTVADFMVNLQGAKYRDAKVFSGVKLGYMKEKSFTQRNVKEAILLKSFDVTAIVEPLKKKEDEQKDRKKDQKPKTSKKSKE